MNDKSLLDLLKFCEAQEISVVFWHKPHEIKVGIPKYRGFDIDVGEMFDVNGQPVALHDFRSIIIANPDNPYVQEHRTTGVHLHD
jgi:hypothetical protein